MTTWMALFGLVWLLRVRGSLCGCAACRRARDAPPSERAPSPERAPFDVITLQQYTRDVTVQTDFDDEDDLDKIELQITEECEFNIALLLKVRICFFISLFLLRANEQAGCVMGHDHHRQ